MDFLFSLSDPFSSIVKSSTTFLDRNRMWHGGCFVLSDDMTDGDLKCRYNMKMEGIEMRYVFQLEERMEKMTGRAGHTYTCCVSLLGWEIINSQVIIL